MTFTVDMGFPAVAIVVVLDVAVSAVRFVQLVFALQVVAVTFFPLALDVVGVGVLQKAKHRYYISSNFCYMFKLDFRINRASLYIENNSLKIDCKK